MRRDGAGPGATAGPESVQYIAGPGGPGTTVGTEEQLGNYQLPIKMS